MQVFSRRPFVIGRPKHHRAARTGLGPWLGLLLILFSFQAAGASHDANTNEQQIAAVKARMNAAIHRVQQIVNRPVTELRRTPGMDVWKSSPGWFHPGAIKPDFLTTDVRKTQTFPYHKYVTSDLNPGVVFLGSELEFNPMTKYFYTDRSVPKKRLTEAEMLEINKLYRVIGHCEHRLFDLEHPVEKERLAKSQSTDQPSTHPTMLATIHRFIFTHKPLAGGMVAALLALIIFLRIIRGRSSAE